MALPKYQKAVASPKAEPKKRGKKRAQSPTAAATTQLVHLEPASKKREKANSAAVQIAAANAAAAKREEIAKAINEAQCVPAAVREMLCSVLPGCGVATGQFHPFQERVLRMLRQTLKEIQAEKTGKFQRAASILTRTKEQLDRWEKEHTNAETAVATSSADAKEKLAFLAEVTPMMESTQATLDEMQGNLQRGDALIGAAAMETEQLRSMRAHMHDDSEETTLARLQKLCSGWELGPEKFQNLTLLEGEICQRLGTLSETISKSAVARVTLAAGVTDAQKRLDTAQEKQQAYALALEQTQSEQLTHATVLKTSAQALKQHKINANQAVRAWRTAQRSLAEFHKGPGSAFKDIANEIEQRHGINLFDDMTEMSPLADINKGSDLGLSQLFPSGTPVIDRRQQTAVLRRRSAALPVSCFTRQSLMARRSSMAFRPRPEVDSDEDMAEKSPTAEVKEGGDVALAQLLASGTPVIDRRQQQAVLRRRSAALPVSCFTRQSLMARRSSMLFGPRPDVDSDEVDKGASQVVSPRMQKTEEMGQDVMVLDGALDVPTPSRRSFEAGPH